MIVLESNFSFLIYFYEFGVSIDKCNRTSMNNINECKIITGHYSISKRTNNINNKTVEELHIIGMGSKLIRIQIW